MRLWQVVSPVSAEDRPPVETDVHTAELPATPTRDYLIPATRWIEAPRELLDLGRDLGIDLVAYKRRIRRFLLWRAGPARGGDARYMAIAADDLSERYTFRLHADGRAYGLGPDGVDHARFRTWKEALRDSAARRPGE
jgi:hypothetical protein